MADETNDTNKSDDQNTSPKKPSHEAKAIAESSKDDKASPADLFNAKPLPKMQAKKSKKGWLLPGITILLVIIAILASSWSIYQQQLFQENWDELQSNVDSKIQQQSQSIEQSKNAFQTSQQAINQTQIQLNQFAAKNQQLAESLLSTQEKIKALSGRQKQDWMLAEAAYLIKVAQLQLSLQKDKATAIQLLRTADSRIIEIADNSLLPIREGIAKDLSELSLILEPDVTGMSLTLNAFIQQLPNLEIVALQFQPLEEKLSEPIIEEDGFDLNEIYQKFLKDFVVIKDHSEPVKPLMKDDQRVNLVNNVQLALQQSQIALAKGNEQLYRLNITNAILWIETFFKKNEKTNIIIEQLNQLKSMPVEIHYPNELNSKKALDQISQQQLYRWLESSLSNGSKNNFNNENSLKLKDAIDPTPQDTAPETENQP